MPLISLALSTLILRSSSAVGSYNGDLRLFSKCCGDEIVPIPGEKAHQLH